MSDIPRYFEIERGIFEHNGELYFSEETEDGEEFDYNSVPTFRRVVGTGNELDDYDDMGFLADNKKRRVYKSVPVDLYGKSDFIVFRNEDKRAYCIRNGCDNCSLKEECKVELFEFTEDGMAKL